MLLYHAIIAAVAFIWLIFISLNLDTNNFKSIFIFKVIPMFLGIGCLFSSLKLFGLI